MTRVVVDGNPREGAWAAGERGRVLARDVEAACSFLAPTRLISSRIATYQQSKAGRSSSLVRPAFESGCVPASPSLTPADSKRHIELEPPGAQLAFIVDTHTLRTSKGTSGTNHAHTPVKAHSTQTGGSLLLGGTLPERLAIINHANFFDNPSC